MSANPHILVVEDNPDNRKLVAWLLEDIDATFQAVESAEEAFPALESRRFDLVLMDISLPGMDGKEATRRLRRDPRYAELPIVAVTAHAIETEKQAIRDCGVTALITKPIIESDFFDVVRGCLGLSA